jgi:hypothetical protein
MIFRKIMILSVVQIKCDYMQYKYKFSRSVNYDLSVYVNILLAVIGFNVRAATLFDIIRTKPIFFSQ